jgi:hypothetical protein
MGSERLFAGSDRGVLFPPPEIVARVGEEASLKAAMAALDTRQRKQDISRYGEGQSAADRKR